MVMFDDDLEKNILTAIRMNVELNRKSGAAVCITPAGKLSIMFSQEAMEITSTRKPERI